MKQKLKWVSLVLGILIATFLAFARSQAGPDELTANLPFSVSRTNHMFIQKPNGDLTENETWELNDVSIGDALAYFKGKYQEQSGWKWTNWKNPQATGDLATSNKTRTVITIHHFSQRVLVTRSRNYSKVGYLWDWLESRGQLKVWRSGPVRGGYAPLREAAFPELWP